MSEQIKTYDTIPKLLEVFDDEIGKYITPFMQGLNASITHGYSNFDKLNTPPSLNQNSRGENLNFWYVNRFVIDNTVLDIGYGDKEQSLDLAIYYTDKELVFSPWEILRTSDDLSLALLPQDFVCSVQFMQENILRLADDLKNNWPKLYSPSEKILDETIILREKTNLEAHQKQYGYDREEACVKALSEFHAGRYDQAEKLLAKYKNDPDMSESAKKMLLIVRPHKKSLFACITALFNRIKIKTN